MSNYRAGDIIRLTRNSLGITQEKLSEDICSVETLSRIENGKHGIKKSTYQLLMERMGRSAGKSYAVLSVQDYNIFDERDKMQTALIKYDFIEAEKNFEKLSKEMEDTALNKQYMIRIRTLLDYFQDRISKEDFLDGMKKAIEITVSDFELFIDKVYPYVEQEIQILMNLATAYSQLENFQEAIKILEMLIKILDTDYMRSSDSEGLKLILMNNLAKAYGEIEDYDRAVSICKEALTLAKKVKEVTVIPNILLEISWNMIQQIELGKRDRKDLDICKKYLRQGYALAAAKKKIKMKNNIANFYMSYFKENVYLINPSQLGEP